MLVIHPTLIMRYTLFAFILIVLYGCSQPPPKQPVVAIVKDSTPPAPKIIDTPKITLPVLNKVIETIVTDLNNDQLPDTIRLSQDTATNATDWYNRISLLITGHEQQFFKTNDGWYKTDSTFLKHNKNTVKSEKVFVYNDSTQSILLLSGSPVEVGREFYVIWIKGNVAKMVFKEEMDYATKLSDLDNDGIVELVGNTHSEVYNQTATANICTYDPFYVYSISDDCKLNKPLTQKYNEEHYVWAGLSNPKAKVRMPFDKSKPTLVK